MRRSPASFLIALVAVTYILTVSCREVDITAVDVARIEISPADASIHVDEVRRMTARVPSSNGDVLSGRTVEWTSLNPEFAAVSNTGDVTGITPGVAVIRASSDGVAGSAEVTVTPAPAILLAPADIEFIAIQNGASPGDRTIAVTNSGSGTLAGLGVAISYAEGQPDGWLTASLTGTTAPTSLVLSADHGGLAAGSYTASVEVAAAVATNSPASVIVQMTVLTPTPAINLSATDITFSAAQGGSNPAQQTVGVTNVGGGTLTGLAVTV
ncbi:MAG: Ig-like domain-containing protein, partial [Longimicrobiales bacterium]